MNRDDQQWSEHPIVAPDEPPPIVEEPVHVRQKSSLELFAGGNILGKWNFIYWIINYIYLIINEYTIGDIRSGRVLRKAAPPPPKERNARETSLDLIKSGGVQLKRAEPIAKKNTTEQVYLLHFNSLLLLIIIPYFFSVLVQLLQFYQIVHKLLEVILIVILLIVISLMMIYFSYLISNIVNYKLANKFKHIF